MPRDGIEEGIAMSEFMSTDVNQRVDALRERAQVKPQSWRFDDNGSELVGTFQGWTSAIAEWNGKRRRVPIAILVDLEGREWSVWVFHTVLGTQFVKADPQNGELVLIQHLGKVDGAGGAYEDYRVVVERAAGSKAGLSIREVAELAGATEELQPQSSSDRPQLSRTEHERAVDAAAEEAASGAAYDRPDPRDDDIPF